MRLIHFLCTIFIFSGSLAQVPKKRLPQNINVPTYSHIFPSLSGDGNQIIFLTNYSNSEGFETKYSTKNGAESWEDPEVLSSINRPGQDHIGSFCLSYDGNFVVFASRRTPTIGNFDIFISEKVGNYWTQPKNPGKPLNSPAHEGNPSLSPDGKSIYFTRCESMDNTNKNNCAIFVSHRASASRWSEPKMLPGHINTGHETTPRIMADNKTLIFASGRSGGKGRLDLYQSTLEYGTWSEPQPLSFINTEENDEFISVPARGDIIYFSDKYRDQYNIYKAIIPEEFRSQKVLMVTGKVNYSDGKKPAEDVLIQAFVAETGEVFTTTRLRENDNSFTIFLPEGASYDVSAFPQKGGHTYFAKIIDLENMLISRKEEMEINLGAVLPGLTLPLSTIRFGEYSADLSVESEVEIKRIVGFMKKNPGLKLEIGAYIDAVYTDSIPSSDLTEVITDTVLFHVNKPDSTLDEEPIIESYDNDKLIEIDSTRDLESAQSMELSDDSNDSLQFVLEPLVSPIDSVKNMGFELLEETEEELIYYKINYTYHNDRTSKQAAALLNKLISSGVPANLLQAKGYGDNWTEDHASEERNYWIELKILP
jgi:Tol biopolymer transport system component